VVETVAWAAGNGDRSENGDYIYGKRRLREIDRRIRFLSMRLESAEVMDPKQQKKLNQVFLARPSLGQRAQERKDHHNRRYRRGQSQSRSGELGIARRQGADEGV
jgi:transcription elongation GreA/GreB family factor